MATQCGVCNVYSNKLSYTYWEEYVCGEHASDGTLRCHTCRRFKKAQDPEYLDLNDNGRKLCSYCSSIATLDPKECMPLIQNVREFYRSLNIVVDETIPFLLVDKDMMLKFIPAVKETIGTVWYKDSSVRSCTTIKKCSTREGIIKVEKQTERLTRRCNLLTLRRKSSVKALIILFGTPGVSIGETMAHEMMHAWFYLQGCRGKLERSVEEGICRLMGYMWMEWFCTSGVDSFYKTSVQVQYTKDLKDYMAHCMELTQDKIYGQGFRDAIKAVSKFGFNYTVDYIVKNKCLPCEMDPAPLQCRGGAVM